MLVRWDAAPGTSLPEMDRLTARAARELRALPGVTEIGGHVGRAVTADQIVGVNSGELWVTISPDANYGRDARVDPERDERLPGAREPRRGVLDREGQGEPRRSHEQRHRRPASTARNCRCSRAPRPSWRRKLGGIDGVTRARVARQLSEPTIKVQVNLDKADKFGLKPGDVRRAAATLLSGTLVGSLFEKQRVFDVVVWGTPQTRSNLTRRPQPPDRDALRRACPSQSGRRRAHRTVAARSSNARPSRA